MKITDDTLALLKNPYRFISTKCNDLGKDVFETRIFLKRAYCMSGKEASELFYHSDYFVRAGASPESLRATLFGKGGVHGLDGSEHAHRKLMFMSIMSEENTRELTHIFLNKMRQYLKRWTLKDHIILYDELQKVLTETACEWVGISLSTEDHYRRTKEIVSLFDSAGAKGINHFLARVSRKNAEDWVKSIVIDLRSDGFEPVAKSPLEIIVWHRDYNDELLNPHTVAVEVLNLLRPTVATSIYMVFLAHALHSNPDSAQELIEREANGDTSYSDNFINEVRRYYPFFPSVVAKVKEDFIWKEVTFKKGARVFLDLYGTNNDPRLWDSPHTFWPERFDYYTPNDFDFIPQGGGDAYHGHRCPGELFTIELMKTALHFFLYEMSYEVPEQNMDIEWSRLPALPHDRFIMSKIQARPLFIKSIVKEIEVTEFFQ